MLKSVLQWLPLIGAILSAGMWLGSLQQRVTQLEREELYSHGNIERFIPK